MNACTRRPRDGIGEVKVRESARDNVPGAAEPGFEIDADDLNPNLLTVSRPSPLRRSRNEFARRCDTWRCENDGSLPLRERDALLDVGDVGCRNPDVGARLVDEARRRRCEADEQPELHHDEHHRKHDARDRDAEPDPVVD